MFTTGISNTDSGNITTASGSNALTNIGSVSSTGTATWGAWTGWPTYYGDGFTYWPPFMKRWDDSVWPIYDITWYYGNNYVNIYPFSKKEDGKYYAEFELAGVKREDINVTFTDKTLTFKSPKRSTTSQFPEDVDSVDATYVDGLLKLVVTLKVPPLTNVEIK